MKKVLKIIAGIVVTVVLVGLIAFGVAVYQYFPGYNFRVVEQGGFYGSRQMNGPALEKYIQQYGIKTVINLRGNNPGSSWFDAEAVACAKLGIAHEDFSWSRNSLPDPESLARYVALIQTGGKPFLAHCEGGTHRTGLAAAIYELLHGKNTATARKQFGPGFKNAPIGEVITLFEQQTPPMPFPQWVKEVYPTAYAARQPAPELPAATVAPVTAVPSS